jgi:hypothetical protein
MQNDPEYGCLDGRLLGTVIIGIGSGLKAEYDRIEQLRVSVNATSSRLLTVFATLIAALHGRVLSEALVSYHIILRIIATMLFPLPLMAINNRVEKLRVVPLYNLPNDTISHILSFCQPHELVNFSLTCKYASSFVHSQECESVNWLWKELSYNLYLRDRKRESSQLSHPNRTWKDEFKMMSRYRYDTSEISSHFPVKIARYNMTAENINSAASEWITLHSQIELLPGKVHRFELVLNQLIQVAQNSYWVQFGIESPEFPFRDQDHLTDVIACKRDFGGVGLILGVGKVRYRGVQRDYCTNVSFKSGDVIGIVLDMRKSSSTEDEKINQLQETGTLLGSQPIREDLGGASIEFFHNNTSLGVAYQNIPGIKFYPTVSIVEEQIVTIKYWASEHNSEGASS